MDRVTRLLSELVAIPSVNPMGRALLGPGVLERGMTDYLERFFRDLCTPAELQAIADRWAVVDWLQKGVPYREIHRLTGVSVTTIGRVARCLSDGNGGYSLAVNRLQRHA